MAAPVSIVIRLIMPVLKRRVALLVLASVLAAVAPESLSSQTSRSTQAGLLLLHKLQDALGGEKRIAAVRDFEETVRAEAWDASGAPLGEVRKRTRWMRTPSVLRLDQRGPRGTYVLSRWLIPIVRCRPKCSMKAGGRFQAFASPQTG
jgi:hypothetical protein